MRCVSQFSGFWTSVSLCFAELDRYVEPEVAGADADAAIPGLPAHLHRCPTCREEHDSLYALVSGEQAL